MPTTTENKPVAIITGASSGIGWQTALAYAARGYSLALAARRADRLEELARLCRAGGALALVVPTDVSKQSQVQALVARTLDAFGRIDVLVNNAGFGQGGRVYEVSDKQMRDAMDVNFFGVFYGCQAVAPIMIRAAESSGSNPPAVSSGSNRSPVSAKSNRRCNGHIFNISSVIGKRATPMNGAYCAAKFAVAGLTESLRVELAPWNIRVTLVCPGLTDTDFFNQVRPPDLEFAGRALPAADLRGGAPAPPREKHKSRQGNPNPPDANEPSRANSPKSGRDYFPAVPGKGASSAALSHAGVSAPGESTDRPRKSFERFRTMMSPEKVARRIVRATGRSVPEMVLTLGGKTLVLASKLSPRLADWMLGFYRDDLAKDDSVK